MNKKRVLVCGDRNWLDKDTIKTYLIQLKPEVVIEGECKGADLLAKECAIELGIIVESYPANWQEYGKAAGMVRNKEMIIKGKPDLVVAFHNNIDNSKGTKDMLAQAAKYKIPTILIGD